MERIMDLDSSWSIKNYDIIGHYPTSNQTLFKFLESDSKKNAKNVCLHSVFNTYDYAFLFLYTQSRHFDNSKMVNWVNLIQKLTKIQGKMQKFKL